MASEVEMSGAWNRRMTQAEIAALWHRIKNIGSDCVIPTKWEVEERTYGPGFKSMRTLTAINLYRIDGVQVLGTVMA